MKNIAYSVVENVESVENVEKQGKREVFRAD
jgi:hypothetical protein